jgi:hypothetical protein
MTFRQIAEQVMLAKGMTPEEVALRTKMSNAFVPGANVDREVPPEDEPALRQHLSDLHDAAMRHPIVVATILDDHLQRTQANN